MTSVMLACYPEVFAGGAIIAGLPYGAASNVQQAFESMFQSPSRSAREWGDLVRAATPYGGPWPRISVWHGTADKIVVPSNAREILKQWTDVHGLPGMPSMEGSVAGYPRQVWLNDAGKELIESSQSTWDTARHWPPRTADGECGVAGPFLLDVGISSSYQIVKFFRLTNEPASAAHAKKTIVPSERRDDAYAAAFYQRPIVGGPRQAKELDGDVLEGELLDKDTEMGPVHEQISRMPVDISSVITRALTAAGLMKPD